MKILKLLYIVVFLAFLTLIIAFIQMPDGNLHVTVCDVGQGDAILVAYKNIQILTDGGPDNKVLTCLGRYMPFWDREIELLISTHPDSDHITGLVETARRFKVDQILINPIDTGTPTYRLLESAVGGKGIPVVYPVSGKTIRLGMIYLDILHPNNNSYDGLNNKEASGKLSKYFKNTDTNSYSISYKISFKNFRGYMLGDIDPKVGDELLKSNLVVKGNYIKIPHHGSSNGITENLLKVIEPELAVISVGKNNRWGLPSKKILDLLKKYNAKVLRTDKSGDVEIITDGLKYWRKN